MHPVRYTAAKDKPPAEKTREKHSLFTRNVVVRTKRNLIPPSYRSPVTFSTRHLTIARKVPSSPPLPPPRSPGTPKAPHHPNHQVLIRLPNCCRQSRNSAGLRRVAGQLVLATQRETPRSKRRRRRHALCPPKRSPAARAHDPARLAGRRGPRLLGSFRCGGRFV